MSDTIALLTVEPDDKFHFSRRICLRMRPDGSLRLETWRDRWASALSETFWPSKRGRTAVTSIDREAGVVTMGHR